jgi:aminoglycoside 2''-phosphotransferase
MDVPGTWLDRIAAACPELRVDTAELNQEGLVNDVVIVNGERVFRFPKSDRAKSALAHEVTVLAIVRERCSLPVPNLELLADDVSAHRMIAGRPMDRDTVLRLTAGEREVVFDQLGGFLLALHGIDANAADGVRESDATRNRDDWLVFASRLQEALFPLLMRYQREWVIAHFEPIRTGELELGYDPVMIHADLAPYHILFDEKSARIAGVIDFGTAGLGDPAVDIACLITQYGESFVRDLAPYYPPLATIMDRARFWAGTLELQWALAGIDADDRSLLVAHIGSARDVRPLGSPIG